MNLDKTKHADLDDAPACDVVAYRAAIKYIRNKVDQLLTVMGTLPLDQEELDDATLIALDPIGIIAESFKQILSHLQETNTALTFARDEIQQILDSVGMAIVVVDRDLQIVAANLLAQRTLLHGADYLHRPLCEILKQAEGAYQQMFLRIAETNTKVERADVYYQNHHYHTVATPIQDIHGELLQVIFSFSDITERKLVEDRLRLLSVVFENTTEGIIITDKDKKIIAVNEPFTQMTGYERDEVLGKSPSLLSSGLHDNSFFEAMWKDIAEHGSWRGEMWDRRKDGEAFPVLQAISQVNAEDGTPTHYVSILTDISAIKASQKHLDFLAYHDPLTKLPNRLLFNERLDHACQLAKRDRRRLAVIFVDLDRFKNINDSLGHQIGDKLLIASARRLTNLLRASDTIARLGGDEFIILLEDIDDPQAIAMLCSNLLAAFEAPFSIDDHSLHITPSMGISLFPDDGQDVDTLVKNADAAMYRAKEEGRNDFQFFTHELSTRANERLTLEASLRKALELNQLRLHYQPQIDMHNGRIVSAEALLRWEHPALGLIPPDKFIPLAEETGLIVPIGEWVLQTACRQAYAWIKRYPFFRSIAVNISGRQFQGGKLVTTVQQMLEQSGLPACNLELEITESYLMGKAEQTVITLDALRELGLSLSIDDFGTGYSSLGYLKRFAVDKLKIDRSFVRDVTTDPNDEAIAKAVIALGHSLQMQIVAEGIETPEQCALLLQHGCDLAQGYLFSRPVPAEAFAQLLAVEAAKGR
ncbi:MAG TPA: EAL domain-containing protein [Gammaproteobacteria bacterium]|nr:EAL domain-containing protein [Gammaproteobacteria bacterium]